MTDSFIQEDVATPQEPFKHPLAESISALEKSGFSEQEATKFVNTTMDSIHAIIDPIMLRFDAIDQKIDALQQTMDKKIDGKFQSQGDKFQSLNDKLNRLHYALLGYTIGIAIFFVSTAAFF